MFVNIEDVSRDEARRFVYDGSLLTGDVVVTDRTGNVIGLTRVRNGVANGVDRGWYSDGTLKHETVILDGGAVETSRHWHPNGQLAEERTFDNRGRLVKTLRWATDGTALPEYPGRASA